MCVYFLLHDMFSRANITFVSFIWPVPMLHTAAVATEAACRYEAFMLAYKYYNGEYIFADVYIHSYAYDVWI